MAEYEGVEKYNITVDDLGHSSVADNKIPNIKAEEEKTDGENK